MTSPNKQSSPTTLPKLHSAWYNSAMERLLQVVQELSHVRDMDAIAKIVRSAARELTGADGATFILRDGNQCHYVDEDALSPLWKGQRFPMSACVSGWVMLNANSTIIEDIFNDSRVPIEAYRPTFVKSMAMVPIRRETPIGAIGNYWAKHHHPTDEEIEILQALADTTSVAIENAQLYTQLRTKVSELEETNHELSRFAWVASHDLQEPLRTIATQVELLQRRYAAQLDDRGKSYIQMAAQGANRLQNLIQDLLVHARAEKIEHFRPIPLGPILENVLKDIEHLTEEHSATIQASELPWVWGDPVLLSRLLQNLISNGIKFQPPGSRPTIMIDSVQQGKDWVLSVSDNGIGIPKEYQERIFGIFQRLHPQDHYPGSGIGLATCKKIVELHSGRIWVESTPGTGSTFRFTIPVPESLDKAMQRIKS